MHSNKTLLAVAALALSFSLPTLAAPGVRRAAAVYTTTCNGMTYVYEELAGYGFLPSNARDKYGDTLGGIGSSIAMDKSSWKKVGKNYQGILYALPDRGWNVRVDIAKAGMQRRWLKRLARHKARLITRTEYEHQLASPNTICMH
jgi:hypothetical protein